MMIVRSLSMSWSDRTGRTMSSPSDVHRPGGLAPRDADPVDGRLAVGRGVERAADALDRLADRPGRRIGRRALERDVLHEVRDAGLAVGLEARPGQDVGRDGDGTRPGHPGADDARPGGQLGSFEHAGMVAHRGRGDRQGRDARRLSFGERLHGPGPGWSASPERAWEGADAACSKATFERHCEENTHARHSSQVAVAAGGGRPRLRSL